ncbi:MAG TPA: UvrD-helicase domain-containing protein [Chloroflexota bacterium]|nr:UvrD-helicase domain-containing protein [Chloroflexota bacterium]
MTPLSLRPADQLVRDRIASDLDTTFFVEAGAGTGKTRELVERIAALVASGVPVERIAAITFTDAAAAELRGRVRQRLEQAAADASLPADRRARCAEGAFDVDLAAIQTIHSFAGGLLRLFPLEAGLPPDFTMWNELERDLAFKERFRRWLYDEVPASPEAARSVRLALGLGLTASRLADIAERLQDHYDLLHSGASWRPSFLPEPVEAAREVGRLLTGLPRLLPLARDPEHDPLAADIRAVQVVARRLLDVSKPEDALIALKRLREMAIGGWRGRQADWDQDHLGSPVPRIRETFKTANQLADDTLALHRSAALGELLVHLREFTLAFAEERRAQGVAMFHDLLVWARDLLRDRPDVRRRAHDRFQRVLVDEFQDTDPLQVEIAWFLTASPAQATERDWRKLRPEPGRLFVVGDPKQSIYRFRRADIGIYEDVRAALGEGSEVVALTQNFRSVEPLLAWVNHHLGAHMTHEPGVQPDYRALHPRPGSLDCQPPRHGAYRLGGPVDGKAGDRWLAEARSVAALAHQIIRDGWLVTSGSDAAPRPARYGDICVLLPTRTNLRRLERAFAFRDVPYRIESGSLVLNTQEVRDLLSCLRAIEDPSDEVALVAALRSPAYGCSDLDLLAWVEAGGRFDYEHPFSGEEPAGQVRHAGVDRVQAALASLREFHAARHRRSSAATIDAFIRDRTLALQAFGQPRPREAWRRLRYVVAQARRLAESGQPSLRSAVEWLEGLQRESFYDAESAVAEADEDAVRFMTVHGSKGLEFPIVILTGLGVLRRRPQGPHVAADRHEARLELYLNASFATAGFDSQRDERMDRAEQLRLLYVAATRARDHLVLSLFHTARELDSPAAHILDGLRDAPELCHELDVADAPPPVLARPPLIAEPVSPDAHRAAEDAWLRARQALLAALAAERRFTATSLAHSAGVPSETFEDDEEEPDELDPLTVREDAAAEPVTMLRGGRGSTSLGLAVHSVLQTIDLATLADLETLAASAAARYAIPDRVDDVARLVRSAAASAPVQAALAGGRFWREVPIGISYEGTLLEGYIDLLYEQAGGALVVVDYKTDRITPAELASRMSAYRLQGAAYAFALEQALGREVARVEFIFAALAQTATISDLAPIVSQVERMLAGQAPPSQA